ncbi:hypothetical protein HZA86_00810 [Candidatus Uhrbacteria bacterium]|nr:hypothetical protein [Candidatus Uhrbacteria bacterium]
MPRNPFEQPNIEIGLATAGDLDAIKELMQKNLKEHLTTEEQETQGFLSVDYPREMLEEIVSNPNEGITIAKENGQLVGYLMPITVEHAKQIPILDPFVARLRDLKYAGKPLNDFRYCILGQVCVEKDHRGSGKGILGKLYAGMKERLSNQYDLGVSEIGADNARSLSAHLKKIGLTVVEEYSAEGKDWNLVIYDFR